MFRVKKHAVKAGIIGIVSIALVCACFDSVLAEEIVARGSDSTIEVVKALADAFQKKTGVAIKVEGGGSSKGAKDCLAGAVGLAFMSRAPKEKEIQAGLVGMPYAIDGVAVIVNQNNPTEDIKLDLLKNIYSGKTKKWNDGKTILALNRPETSGTREVFQKKVLGKEAEFDPTIEIQEHKAALDTVTKTDGAIAYTSAGALSSHEKLKVLSVVGVKPSPETLRDGSYPISRTPHFGTKGTPEGKVKDFLDFVSSPEGQKVVQNSGFVSLK